MNKYILSTSLVLGILFTLGFIFQQDQGLVISNLEIEPDIAVQDTFEKTVTQESITRLISTPELTPEQAKIFHASLPNSLTDSPLPSLLDIDDQGLLIINMKIKHLFEFYLSAMGEDTLAECVLRIRHDLSNQLEGESLDTALDLLESFLQYQNNIGEIKNDFVARYSQNAYDINRVTEMKMAVRQSRDVFFSAEATNAFYQQEDEYDDYMLKHVAIKTDQSLSSEQKQASYDTLNAETPAWILEQDQQANLVSKVQKQEQAIRENGGDEYAIQALRETHYGIEAANNLALLDTQRNEWSQRVTQYRSVSQGIHSSDQYTPAEKEQLLNDIRIQHFTGSELVRIKALDIIANQ